MAPPPFRAPLPPAAVDNDDDLPPYDPPPGYRRAPQAGPTVSSAGYETEALPPPGPYGAAPGAVPNYPPQGREPIWSAPGYPPGREPAYQPPPGQYGAAPLPDIVNLLTVRRPAMSRSADPSAARNTAPSPPQQDDSIRPPMGIGPGPGGQQQGAVDPDITSRLPMDDRPETGPRKELPPQFRRTTVEYRTREPAGTIIIDTANTYLYLVLGNGQAIRYGIGVGREGFTWNGAQRVSRMAEWPDWHPPSEMIERQPYLPRFMAGGEGNPLGARALYLGKTLYRIHGTNQPSTIGSFVSSGCIRLTNEDVSDLYTRVKVGTRVVVLPGQAAGARRRRRPVRRRRSGRQCRRRNRPKTTASRSRCSRRRLSRRAEQVSQIKTCDARSWTGHRRFGAAAGGHVTGFAGAAFFETAWAHAVSSALFRSAALSADSLAVVQPCLPHAFGTGANAFGASRHFNSCSSGVNLKLAVRPSAASVT